MFVFVKYYIFSSTKIRCRYLLYLGQMKTNIGCSGTIENQKQFNLMVEQNQRTQIWVSAGITIIMWRTENNVATIFIYVMSGIRRLSSSWLASHYNLLKGFLNTFSFRLPLSIVSFICLLYSKFHIPLSLGIDFISLCFSFSYSLYFITVLVWRNSGVENQRIR